MTAWSRGAFAVFAALAVLSLALASTAQASKPVKVRCGQVIAQDTTLGNDLVNCPGVAIVIGAVGITLDLNGHRVDGDGRADVEGIHDDGYDGVTIENGTVTDFVEGVAVLRARNIHIRTLTTGNNRHAGVFVDTVRDSTIEANAAADQCAGVIVTRSSGVLVDGNVVNGGACSGIPIFESTGVRIVGNAVSHMQGQAIALYRGCHDSEIDGNTVTAGAAEGIAVTDSGSRNLIDQNTVVGNGGDGIVLDIGTSHDTVTNNSIRNNVYGGLAIVGSDDNVVSGNSIVGNGSVSDADGGIRLLADPDNPATTSDHNVLSGNDVRANAPNGILIENGQSKTLLDRNRSDSNANNGIEVDSRATKVSGNSANQNGALGILAVHGVTDGGGNTASGNGDPLQCTGVVCR